MVKSMTGFGRYEDTINGLHIIVEIRAVNHRYYEYSSHLPRIYGYLDEKLKSHLQTRIARGKVEVGVWIETRDCPNSEVMINHSLANGYVQALHELSERYALKGEVSAMALTRFPDILIVRHTPENEDAVWEAVRTVTDEALARFLDMRVREGARLRDDVLSRVATILDIVTYVEERSPQTVREHMAKVEARMRELLNGAAVDEQRLITEAAIYADKIAVAEETVRLRSHFDQLKQMLDSDEAVGRKLDFLVQEINRETNTIGSKACDLEITHKVVDAKAEIEKIREQIQNIE